ncbi:MAG TPA: DUF697 domain-containing protein [Polyangium sp.]|nr:DUF697 domain-containing protein [Polyangium sp.]
MEETTQQSTSKLDKANRLIRYHALGAGAIVLVPMPWVDFAGLTGVQVNLVWNLAKLYGLPFSDELARSLISALLGSTLSGAIAFGAVATVPFPHVKLVVGPVVSAAVTYAVGKVFVQHFEAGGTFLTFEPDKVREHFAQEFRKSVSKTQPVSQPEDFEIDYGGIMP